MDEAEATGLVMEIRGEYRGYAYYAHDYNDLPDYKVQSGVDGLYLPANRDVHLS